MQRCHFLAPHNLKIMAPMRRKSHGSIRSPHVKRDSQSQVVIEGWLYKLEGGALKQWKQRWCVLADFCLFFYKGPHEEKVTSSILLPSYKINPCSTEDKISRKFSFKAEHQNMKTYYFAAEDKESMKRWMNAMSLASIMQKFVKSENYDATFSSASNDDEESGFSSYRSRRYTSHKLNSTYDPSFIHEPLKQRSNSCGDRMGEVYLGSDDKYPNTFKSIPSHLYKASCTPHDVPRRQPLYANAPPKPKRLTQSEGFPIYPNECYDTRDNMSSSQYHCEVQSSRIPSGHQNQNVKTYLPMETNVSHPPNHDMEYKSAPQNMDHTFAQNAGVEHFSDAYKNQPPRPHSADFLERDSECHVPPDTVQCCENLQPQRPKSSLECYNRYADSEEEDFDDYREAVRVQADNLYANKNLLKPRNSRIPAQETHISTSDQKLNIHYVGNSYYKNKDHMPSSYRAKSVMNERPDVCPKTTQSSYPQNYNIQTSQSKSRKSREESMQRLLEWKQRMLQSPLSKRNHLQSNSSSDASSPMNSPLRTGIQNQYQKQVRKELESHEAELRKYALSGHNKCSYSSPEPNSQPYACEVHHNYMSGKQYQNQQVCDSKVPSFDYESQGDYYAVSEPVQNNSNLNINDSRVYMTENICQENLMYCVDSENNEILFSYDDNSFSSCNIPKTLQNSHYPPQMHSFSTMHNVSDIGNESRDLSTQDGCNSSEQLSVKDEYKKFNNSQEMLDTSNSSAVELQATAYSSDDEASLDSDGRLKSANNKVKYHGLSRASSSFESNVKEPNYVKKLVQQSEGLMCKGKRLSVSAGDLLGKTHEELVLLLIQLRRNQAKILRSKEKLEQQLENELKLPQQSSLGQQLPSQNYKEIRLQIRQLENQYEVTQPLVTLVDNMVKLGSLYGSSQRRSFSLPLLDSSQDEPRHSVEVAQSPEHVGESSILSKLLTEENNLQKRISEIYSLDKGLRHETNSITSLHQDKKMLEHTLCGMQNKILDHQDKPGELQKLRKQQRMIEKELVRVKRLLSTSAKKIEDAASKNDQMEQEILLLRQILQQALKTGSSDLQASQHNRADLEAELTRLQNVLDELANHRHEINNTVEKLKSEARSSMSKGTEVRASPTGVAGSAPLPLRKKQHSTYLETDLDTMTTKDLAVIHEKDGDDIPVYANAEEINSTNEETCVKEIPSLNENAHQAHFLQGDSTEPKQCSMQDINDADERMKRFYGILPKEKPSEIKTVRIVKRQSERRSRERDKKRVTYDDQSSVWVVEEPDISSDDPLDAEEGNNKSTPLSHRPSSIYLFSSNTSRQTNTQSAHERLFGSSSKKETSSTENQDHVSSRRSKRRHYTVSGYQYMLDPQFMQYFKDRPRSRDDVDMERCLRTANTPDIVRSTIKKKEVFDDKIIERELGLPQKIEIPERYVEVESEELSASEKLRRSLKAENICKMLSETTTTYEDVVEERSKSPEALHKKLNEEKRKRAHLLSLNRALAREVVERSKAVAANVCSPENQALN